MNVILRFTEEEELKAMPILFRHSPGTILPNRIYIISESAVQALREAGISYAAIQPELERDVSTL
jgi:hypothetical protein